MLPTNSLVDLLALTLDYETLNQNGTDAYYQAFEREVFTTDSAGIKTGSSRAGQEHLVTWWCCNFFFGDRLQDRDAWIVLVRSIANSDSR